MLKLILVTDVEMREGRLKGAMSSCMRTVVLMTNMLSDERATSKLHVCSREPRTIAQYNHSKFAYLGIAYMQKCLRGFRY